MKSGKTSASDPAIVGVERTEETETVSRSARETMQVIAGTVAARDHEKASESAAVIVGTGIVAATVAAKRSKREAADVG